MKRTILVALVITASIGSQVNLRAAAAAGTTKLGKLTFALTDTFQGPSIKNKGVRTNPGGLYATNTVPSLLACDGSYSYGSSVTKVDNAAVLRAISSALTGTDYKQIGSSSYGVFTSKASLVVWNYDNTLSGPPYPPYLPQSTDPTLTTGASTMNGPRLPVDTSAITVDNTFVDDITIVGAVPTAWIWPNLHQIDWVDYDGTSSRNASLDSSLWPKAQVFVSDPSNASGLYQCVNVTPFFSFEEAYCYFCWDTVDRVTDGTFATGTSGEICIGSSCGTTGKGTTRWYFTIKFDNENAVNRVGANRWLDKYGPGLYAIDTGIIQTGNIEASWLPIGYPYTYPLSVNPPLPTTGSKLRPLAVEAWLQFQVSGVVSYPWQIKTFQGVYAPFGTMTMAQANGFGNNPWCGVLTGSVKIVEQTDVGTPICYDSVFWPTP